MTSPIKSQRLRRTKAEIQAVKDSLYNILLKDHPMTVRQVFYQAVARRVINKIEGEYKSTICRLLVDMRRQGEIPYGWIADNTRWMRKPQTYDSLQAALRSTAEMYRRNLWAMMPAYVEIWLEKDALAGVLWAVTSVWDVPLMVTRGYPSITFLYEAADALRGMNKPVFLYYLGDYDPSGLDIPRVVEKGIREFAPELELCFEMIAVTPSQITALSLPTRPTKQTDRRAKNFNEDSVEVDAIPPSKLRQLVDEAIVRHIDRREYEMVKRTEAAERESLKNIRL